jgi:hypothetical protein
MYPFPVEVFIVGAAILAIILGLRLFMLIGTILAFVMELPFRLYERYHYHHRH